MPINLLIFFLSLVFQQKIKFLVIEKMKKNKKKINHIKIISNKPYTTHKKKTTTFIHYIQFVGVYNDDLCLLLCDVLAEKKRVLDHFPNYLLTTHQLLHSFI